MTIYYKPSVFEILASEGLRHGLREAIRFLTDILRNSQRLQGIPIPPTNELVLLTDLLIEFTYLKSYSASYAENFYYLSRVCPVNCDNKQLTGSSYRKANLLLSLTRVVLVPYFRSKLDEYFEQLHYKQVKTASEINRLRLYRLLTTSCSLLNLIFLVRYTAGASSYHDPLNKIIGTVIMGKIEEGNVPGNDGATNYSLIDRAFKLTADSFGRALTIGSLVIQFLDYWNTRNNSAPIFSSSLKTPHPPKTNDLPFFSFILLTYHISHDN